MILIDLFSFATIMDIIHVRFLKLWPPPPLQCWKYCGTCKRAG